MAMQFGIVVRYVLGLVQTPLPPCNGKTANPRVFRSVGGIWKTHPRNVLALAPNHLKFTFDALARHPQPMLSTHTVLIIFRHGIGASWAATQEGAK